MIILLPDLQPGIDYALQLRSTSGDGVSEWSNRFVISVGGDTVAPDSPSWADTDPWVVDGDTFVATWQPIDTNLEHNSDFSHYLIALSDGTKSVSVKSQNTIYVLTYEQNRNFFGSAKPTITAKVASVDKVGNTSPFTDTLSATNPAPETPASINLTPLIDAIQVDWPANEEDDVTKYLVQYALDNVGGVYSTVYQGSNNSFTMGTTQWGNDHYVRVAAVDKFGSVSSYITAGPARPNSSISGDTTPPNNVADFDAISTGINNTGGKYEAYVNLDWTPSTSNDVSYYEIRYGYDGSTWRYTQVGSENDLTRIDGLALGEDVYFGIRAVDRSSNKSAWRNADTYPYETYADTGAPNTPVAPIVETDRLQLRVEMDAPANVVRYKAYAGTTSGFTANDDSLIGTFEAGTIGVFYYPTDSDANVYVKVIAVSRGGVDSAVSPASAAVSVPRINDAMIDSLGANKITAGEGIITDLTIKSDLTIGDGTDPGSIQSNEFVQSGGASGYQLTDSGLIVKSGSVDSAALNISANENIIRAEYAGFEWSNYDERLATTNGLEFEAVEFDGADGLGHISTSWPAASANPQLFLSETTGIYAQQFEAGTKYIISSYLRVPGAVATNVTLKIKWSDGTFTTVFNANPTAGMDAWQRFSGVVTASQNTGTLVFESSTHTAGAGFDVDMIQIEKAYGGTVPSQWRAPSTTVIDGGMIKTGAIRSNALAVDADGQDLDTPAWVIDPEGDASFGNMHVRGSAVVGSESETLDESWVGKSVIKSYGYVQGVSGWAIRGDGYAEFRNLAADSIDGSSLISNSVTANHIQTETITGDLLSSNVLLSGRITVGQKDLEGAPINDSAIFPIIQLPDSESMDVNVFPESELEYNTWKFVKHTMYSETPEIVTFRPVSWDPNTPLSQYPDGFPAVKFSTKGVGSGVTSAHPTQYGATKVRVLGGTSYRVRVGLAATGIRETGEANFAHTAYVRYKYGSDPEHSYGYVNNGVGVSYSFLDNTQVYWWDFVIRPDQDEDLILSFYMFPTSSTNWALSSTHDYAINLVSPKVSVIGGPAVAPVDGNTPPPEASDKPTLWGYGNYFTSVEYVSDYDISSLMFSWPYTNKIDKTVDGYEFTYTHPTEHADAGTVYVRIPRPPTNFNWSFTYNYVIDYGSGVSGTYNDIYQPYILWKDADGNDVVGANGTAVTQLRWSTIPDGMTGKRGIFGSSYKGYSNALTSDEASRIAYGVLTIRPTVPGKPAGSTTKVKVLGMEAYYTPKDNNNYGNVGGAHIDIDNSAGITLYNADSVPIISLPIDGTTAIYRGDAEVGSLTVNGQLTVNASSMTFGKSADVLLQAGTDSPSASLSISQQFDQWTLNRPSVAGNGKWWDAHEFNPANVTSMVWSQYYDAFFVSELYNGAVHIWRVSTSGAVTYRGTYSRGADGTRWSQPAFFMTPDYEQPGIIGRWGDELRIQWSDGSFEPYTLYSVASHGNSFFRNRSQIGCYYDNVTNPNDPRLVVFQNNGSGMRVTRYQLPKTEGAIGTRYNYYDTPSGSGGSSGMGIAGGVASPADFGAFRWVAANRSTEKVKVLTAHSGTSMQPNQRWDVAAAPVAFTWDGSHFWQIDSSGTLTRYSSWNWTSNDNLYFGATYYDSDTSGGTHETTIGPLTSQPAKKRIGKIVVTLPRVPDGGGPDDPDKVRVYAAKRTTTPSRTQLWLQGSGGSSLAPSQMTILTSGLLTSGSNPPLANNFPSADSAELFSAKSDANGSIIALRGDGSGRLGNMSINTSGELSFSNTPRGGMVATGTGFSMPGTNAWVQVGNWTGNEDPLFTTQGGITLYNNAIRVAQAGTYLATSVIAFQSNASGRRGCAIDVNSSRTGSYANNRQGNFINSGVSAGTVYVLHTTPVVCNAGDYIRVWAWQDSGTNLLCNDTNVAWFRVTKMM